MLLILSSLFLSNTNVNGSTFREPVDIKNDGLSIDISNDSSLALIFANSTHSNNKVDATLKWSNESRNESISYPGIIFNGTSVDLYPEYSISVFLYGINNTLCSGGFSLLKYYDKTSLEISQLPSDKNYCVFVTDNQSVKISGPQSMNIIGSNGAISWNNTEIKEPFIIVLNQTDDKPLVINLTAKHTVSLNKECDCTNGIVYNQSDEINYNVTTDPSCIVLADINIWRLFFVTFFSLQMLILIVFGICFFTRKMKRVCTKKPTTNKLKRQKESIMLNTAPILECSGTYSVPHEYDSQKSDNMIYFSRKAA